MVTLNDPLAALTWLVDSGAGEAVNEQPVDRFAAGKPAPARVSRPRVPYQDSADVTVQAPAGAGRAPNPRADGGDDIGTAIALARSAASLAELNTLLQNFDGCALKHSARNTVFADGNPASRIMLIGEAPGRDEDIQGLPFVGRAGKLLDKMLAAIGLDRTRAYITNVINWRPPNNREPTPEEAAMCIPFLRRHIELVNPEVMILLGSVSMRHVMGRTEGITRLRGRWLEYNVSGRMVPVMPTLHPAYLLRQPSHKRLAWRDLQAIAQKIASLGLPEHPAPGA